MRQNDSKATFYWTNKWKQINDEQLEEIIKRVVRIGGEASVPGRHQQVEAQIRVLRSIGEASIASNKEVPEERMRRGDRGELEN